MITVQERKVRIAAAVATAAQQRAQVENPHESDFSDNDLKYYSLLRVLRCQAEGKALDGLEGEISDHIAMRSKRPARGAFVPTRFLFNGYCHHMRRQAAAVTTSTGSGGILTAVDGNYIDALRALSVTGRLGATFLGGLQGTFGMPRSAGITAYWVTEGNAPTDGAITLDQVTMTPKTIGGRSDFSRTFVRETSLDLEAFAATTIMRTVATGIDQSSVRGSGTSGEPLGILNNTNTQMIVALSGTSSGSGAAPLNLTGSASTWALVVDSEALVAGANSTVEAGGYLLSSAGVQAWKKSVRITGQPVYLAEGAIANGHPLIGSNIVPNTNGTNSGSSAGIFGNWSEMVVGNWGALDVIVDPYTGTGGYLRIVGLQDADIALKHALSFARLYGMATV